MTERSTAKMAGLLAASLLFVAGCRVEPAGTTTGETPPLSSAVPPPVLKGKVEPLPQPDQTFARDIGQIIVAERQIAEMPAGRGSAAELRGFADRVRSDFALLENRLEQISRHRLFEMQAELGAEDAALAAALEELQGHDFDRRYLESEISRLSSAHALILEELDLGRTEVMKDYAAEMLPVVRTLLDRARALHHDLPPATDPPSG